MKIKNTHYTALWYEADTDRVLYIDQTRLPWELVIREMKTFEDGIRAIADMEVRGAPLLGVAAAFAMYLGRNGQVPPSELAARLVGTRPTAVNLARAVEQMLRVTDPSPVTSHSSRLLEKALEIRRAELDCCRMIGEHGLPWIQSVADSKRGEPVSILTHCNAGWLASVDYGTALAPIYLAHDRGIPVHVWVDETRPRNQGAKLTLYELTQHGVPCTLIVDNAGGLLMQQGKVDMVLMGADRIAANGDVANKIGTYLKALAAHDNRVPFYVAAPTSTIDWDTPTGREVPLEERGVDEVLFMDGQKARIAPEGSRVHNPGFDITPAGLVTEYVTENGVVSRVSFHH